MLVDYKYNEPRVVLEAGDHPVDVISLAKIIGATRTDEGNLEILYAIHPDGEAYHKTPEAFDADWETIMVRVRDYHRLQGRELKNSRDQERELKIKLEAEAVKTTWFTILMLLELVVILGILIVFLS